MKREVRTEAAPAPVGPYSQAVSHGGLVWASGQIPLDPKTGEMQEYELDPSARPHSIIDDPAGNIWYTGNGNATIGMLDPKTGESNVYSFPGGKAYEDVDAPPIKGPHSIEEGPNGNMFITLALSGQMGEFDVKTKEFRVGSGHEAPRPRAGYPHTLRFAPNGHLWWTDAALGVFSLDPETWDGERWVVKSYKLPSKDQVRGTGARGESRGVTPYGIDVAPNGNVFYTKLNGQRIGRIIPRTVVAAVPAMAAVVSPGVGEHAARRVGSAQGTTTTSPGRRTIF